MNEEHQEIHVEWLRRLHDHSTEIRFPTRNQVPSTKYFDLRLHRPYALDHWAIESTRLAYRHRGKSTFVEILGLPIFSTKADLAALNEPIGAPRNVARWDVVQGALKAWAPCGVRIQALRRVLTVEQLGHWGPDCSRFLLEQALPGGATFRPALSLPLDSSAGEQEPHLGFLLMVASSDRGWPRRQIHARSQDAMLRSLVEFVLDPPVLGPVNVGIVQSICDGVVQGLCTLLGSETNLLQFTSWDLELDYLDPDRWWLRLDLPDGASPSRRLPLRAHLLGSSGMSRIIATLSARAESRAARLQ